MIALQEMLMQEADGKIYLFPAWPRKWDVSFKLHASGNTVVEAELKDGRVTRISVTPEVRRQDVASLTSNHQSYYCLGGQTRRDVPSL